ncbi:1-deoxy-D-xylulose-5-phosphate reductoisomerase [Bacillus luteolus]|uniref:1-deoxy-D-xylulose 5-phosphate reductoisomerase n=1 Tax=Litchfieldia luteola TaxID=682179 RepID=A0ABR9QJM0_9BACI|nr:1-deoxy-D-xylulose-5-phosphate reductoisomerase [Cytobacillus luteolus]MBE4908695.1 1-deoxy-D-xylulose-5-phosphate reductoisomerase [Cytobacillus luteolus]MBP1941552.1 1-deoxy-D-xylulose-5-phosphate reductoisomerase [Cytobacillus luteolus]
MKKISLLGATGSIGQQTLDVIKAHPGDLELVAMSFGDNIEFGRKIIMDFSPKIVSVRNKEACDTLKTEFTNGITFVYGEEGLVEVATYHEATILVNAVVGSVGLIPTLKAIEAKKTIAIANKETLVTAGHIVMDAAKKHGVSILPVDSEHSAIFQCLQGENDKNIEKIILTGSGGSFRDKRRHELVSVTVEQALNHPNWSMGAKITIDSATMMNKGLEVIEAHWLFELPYDQIDVVLHKESIIHSMVEFHDKSVIAQLGTPDMRVPIQYALSYPDRLMLPSTKSLNLWEVGTLHFSKIDFDRYRCLGLAYHAGKIGGTMPTVLNAANEVAVAAFLNGSISFLTIEAILEKSLEKHQSISNPSLDVIKEVDLEARAYVREQLLQ